MQTGKKLLDVREGIPQHTLASFRWKAHRYDAVRDVAKVDYQVAKEGEASIFSRNVCSAHHSRSNANDSLTKRFFFLDTNWRSVEVSIGSELGVRRLVFYERRR